MIETTLPNQHLEKVKKSLGFYLTAVDEAGEPIGCMMMTYEMNLKLGGLLYMIQSVYVKKEWRGKGVFKTMFETGMDYAKQDTTCKAVRLYVENDNEAAKAVYEKLGMGRQDVVYLERDGGF